MSLARICLTGLLLASPMIDANRGAGGALRGGARQAEGESDDGPAVVKLERVRARRTKGGVPTDATFYVGSIAVGEPAQHLQVMFDTASGHVLLPHRACKSAACLEHHTYSPWASSTAHDVNYDGASVQKEHRVAKGKVNRSFATLEFTQSDLGQGEAKGVLVREHVCLSRGPEGHVGHEACAELAMLAATEEDYTPFGAMPADGIVGLGMESLAVGALSSFYARLLDGTQDMLPEFGISLGETGGEITFGGRAPTAGLTSPLVWFPVARPQDGFWQVAIRAVRVGGTVVDSCEGGCRGIVDTGSSHLGVQHNRLDNLRSALTHSVPAAAGGCQGPELVLELEDGAALTLSATDYSNGACKAELGALELDEPMFKGVYSLGTNVIRRYYAAFDWANARVGFAPNEGSVPLRAEVTPELIPATAAEVEVAVL